MECFAVFFFLFHPNHPAIFATSKTICVIRHTAKSQSVTWKYFQCWNFFKRETGSRKSKIINNSLICIFLFRSLQKKDILKKNCRRYYLAVRYRYYSEVAMIMLWWNSHAKTLTHSHDVTKLANDFAHNISPGSAAKQYFSPNKQDNQSHHIPKKKPLRFLKSNHACNDMKRKEMEMVLIERLCAALYIHVWWQWVLVVPPQFSYCYKSRKFCECGIRVLFTRKTVLSTMSYWPFERLI